MSQQKIHFNLICFHLLIHCATEDEEDKEEEENEEEEDKEEEEMRRRRTRRRRTRRRRKMRRKMRRRRRIKLFTLILGLYVWYVDCLATMVPVCCE